MEKKLKRVVWMWGSDPGFEGSSGKDRGLGQGEMGLDRVGFAIV